MLELFAVDVVGVVLKPCCVCVVCRVNYDAADYADSLRKKQSRRLAMRRFVIIVISSSSVR